MFYRSHYVKSLSSTSSGWSLPSGLVWIISRRWSIDDISIDDVCLLRIVEFNVQASYLHFSDKWSMFMQRSNAAKNFVQEGPVNDVVSHWRRLESDCSFCLFSNSCKLSTSKILSKFRGREGMVSSASFTQCSEHWHFSHAMTMPIAHLQVVRLTVNFKPSALMTQICWFLCDIMDSRTLKHGSRHCR